MTRTRGALALALVLSGCAARHVDAAAAVSAPKVATPEPPSPELSTLLSRAPDLVLTVHPPALARDPVYGPLLRRASELASAYAGPTNLGTTALAVLERTEEIVVAECDRGKEAVVALRGVPASVDPLDLVDTSGRPLWRALHGDTRTTSRELAPTEPSDAALFVAPGRVWLIESGSAIPRARAALVDGVGKGAFAGEDSPLVSLSLPGDAVPQLRRGALAPVGAGLLRARLELSPGAVGLIVGHLDYADALTAASAEGTVLAVTLAFRHRLEEAVQAPDGGAQGQRDAGDARRERPGANLDWLGAAKVERSGSSVVVRAPIPRPWLEALAHAEVAAPKL